jgi:hypothetical protein
MRLRVRPVVHAVAAMIELRHSVFSVDGGHFFAGARFQVVIGR